MAVVPINAYWEEGGRRENLGGVARTKLAMERIAREWLHRSQAAFGAQRVVLAR